MNQRYFLFDLPRTLAWFGPFPVGSYFFLFIAMLICGSLLFFWQLRRGNIPRGQAIRLCVVVIVASVVGARLAEVLFYRGDYFFQNPVEILKIWKGGISSHGVFAAVVLVLTRFAIKNSLSVLDIWDRFMFTSALGAAMVRVGNFLNSEIVGRPTTLPFGVRFFYYDQGKHIRHPTQLYEAALCLFIFGVLLAVDRQQGGERRPRGLLVGLFCTLYFLGRFFIEFTKEYLILDKGSPLTMGQYLSIPPFLLGVVLLLRVCGQPRA